MGSQALKLEQLEDGLPLLYHQNALSYIFANSSNYSFPTQLVYPDTSISIGLNASHNHIISSFEDTQENDEDEQAEENNDKLLIYASQSPDETIKKKLYPYLFKYFTCTVIQVLSLFVLTIVIKSSLKKVLLFGLLLLFDIPLSYAIYNKKLLLTRALQILHMALIFIVFFLYLNSIYDILLILGFFLKSHWIDIMLFFIMPHVFTVPSDHF